MTQTLPSTMVQTVSRKWLYALLAVPACWQLAYAESQGEVSNIAQSSGHAVKSALELPEVWWKTSQYVSWLPEVVMGIFIICYIANMWNGRAKNTDIAMTFAKTYCTEGSLLDRNFSQLGARIDGAPDMILRESMHKFNIYATGRRFCKNFQATLDLKHRQDLLSLASYVISPRNDRIDIDIAMNETNMQPLVLVIATPRLAKDLSKSLPDVKSFARPIDVSQHELPGFPSKRLHVWTESKSTFHELMTDKVMDLLFGRAAFEETSKYFRYLHFSSENPEGFSKHSLKLSFDLPPENQMQDLTQVLTATLHFIDVIGSHQLSPEAKEKAVKRRAKQAAEERKSTAGERQEAHQLKRQEKKQEELEKVKRMTPEQRAKFKAREERIQTKRAMKQRMIRA
ncbi:hypothetical protein ABBQ32_000705 [Trebouxia sp. C0010 RCD-2024]